MCSFGCLTKPILFETLLNFTISLHTFASFLCVGYVICMSHVSQYLFDLQWKVYVLLRVIDLCFLFVGYVGIKIRGQFFLKRWSIMKTNMVSALNVNTHFLLIFICLLVIIFSFKFKLFSFVLYFTPCLLVCVWAFHCWVLPNLASSYA